MPRLGVFGWPVAHSRSPAMHNAAFAALGMDGWRYQLLPVPPELFAATARALGGSRFLGANVTIPHKPAALAVADSASQAARAIGAANMLTVVSDGIYAENTDAPGIIAALAALGGSPARSTVLVLGAGGSARAAVWALREAGADSVCVWNRTPERARRLARELDVRAVKAPVRADILVNCTSVGLEPSATQLAELNQLSLTFDSVGKYSYVLDLVYRSSETALVSAARRHGARACEGVDVLVAQGALSFERWTGRSAPTEVMRSAASAAAEQDDG